MKYIAIRFDEDNISHQYFESTTQALNACRLDLYRRDSIFNVRKFTPRADGYHLRIDETLWYHVCELAPHNFAAIKWDYCSDKVEIVFGSDKNQLDRELFAHWLSDIDTMGVLVG